MNSKVIGKSNALDLGYTLIEVMVASIILGLGIIGAISMLRLAQGMEYDVHLRRQARLLAGSFLEDSLYSASKNWPILVGLRTISPNPILDTLPNPDLTATVTIDVGPVISNWPPGNAVESKIIIATVKNS